MSGLQLILLTALVHVGSAGAADVLARRRHLRYRILLVALVLAFGPISLLVMAGLTRRGPGDNGPGDDWPRIG